MIFLIDYDRSLAVITSMEVFASGNRGVAEQVRLDRGLAYAPAGSDHEVVILEAANETDIRRSRRRYFVDASALTKIPDATG